MEYNEILNLFVQESLKQIDAIEKFLIRFKKANQDVNSLNSILRHLHSIKGASAMFKFNNIADISHKLEDVFIKIKKAQLVPSKNFYLDIFEILNILRSMIQNKDVIDTHHKTMLYTKLNNILNTSQAKLSKKEGNEFIDSFLLFSSQKKEYLSDYLFIDKKNAGKLKEMISDLRYIKKFFRDDKMHKNVDEKLDNLIDNLNIINRLLNYVPFLVIANNYYNILKYLTKNKNKKVELKIISDNIFVNKDYVETINNIIIQIIKNAIAHGIEPVDTRIKNGKKPVGLIKIVALQDNNKVKIIISDDGKGIDFKKIKKIILQKKIITASKIKQLSEKELINFIFLPGFSTKSFANKTSGRGVGLDIIKASIEKLGGNITVDTIYGTSTTFTIQFPINDIFYVIK